MTIETITISGPITREVRGTELRALWWDAAESRGLATFIPIGCDKREAAALVMNFSKRLVEAVSK